MSTGNNFFLGDYEYSLPEELIAQVPVAERGGSRLLVLNTTDGTRQHARFADLASLLPKNALLVANNTRVAPARLYGARPSGGRMEMLLLTPPPLLVQEARQQHDGWHEAEATALLKPGKNVQLGRILSFGPCIQVLPLEKYDFGRCRVLFRWQGDLDRNLEEHGQLPLPPYIKREKGQEQNQEDRQRYQTVYARQDKAGSVAAPTAGLHFTPELRQQLADQGFDWAELTLHVGYGTFSPVREEDIRRHVMHQEYVEISSATALAVREALAMGRPVVAVGTTSARSLEGAAAQNNGEIPVRGWQGWTNIFIYPGFCFNVVTGLISNFHLPRSSLLMLVSALAGREHVLAAYAEAVQKQYRFFSYGDAMLIKTEQTLP